MEFYFELLERDVKTGWDIPKDTTTTFSHLKLTDWVKQVNRTVRVFDLNRNLPPKLLGTLRCPLDVDQFASKQERRLYAPRQEEPMQQRERPPEEIKKAMSAAKEDPISPSHYKSYMDGEDIETLQWLEAMQYLPEYRNPAVFKGAVMLLARKYLDRLGQKDVAVQELGKAVWYLKFIRAYIKNGDKPIRVNDIEAILAGQ